MYKVTYTDNHVLFVTSGDDCEDNKGGYYLEVYTDEDLENEIDNFCINPGEVFSQALAENMKHFGKVSEIIDLAQ